MAMVRWKLFLVPPSGSRKWRWSRKASVCVVKELRDNGVIQYTILRDEFGEEAVDEMINEHFWI
jgi:hypothetical protein